MRKQATPIVTVPRYHVEPASNGTGFTIVDSTGKDQPYIIDRCNSDGVDISDASRQVAEDWCWTWNIVEMGYCGACARPLQPGERYPAVGFHRLDKVVCFSCACSQED